jgi:hypothetical protein
VWAGVLSLMMMGSQMHFPGVGHTSNFWKNQGTKYEKVPEEGAGGTIKE